MFDNDEFRQLWDRARRRRRIVRVTVAALFLAAFVVLVALPLLGVV